MDLYKDWEPDLRAVTEVCRCELMPKYSDIMYRPTGRWRNDEVGYQPGSRLTALR